MAHISARLSDEEVAVLDTLATLIRGNRSDALRQILIDWKPPEGTEPAVVAVRTAHRALRRAAGHLAPPPTRETP